MSQSSNQRDHKRKWNRIKFFLLAVLCIAGILTILFFSCTNLKANVLNLILDVYDSKEDAAIVDSSDAFYFTPRWLPTGCVLKQEEESIDSYYQYYEDEHGNSVFIQKIAAEGQVITLDTEDAELTEITVQGYDGTMIVKGMACQIIWLHSGQNMCIIVATEGYSSRDALEIAENLEV